MNITLLYVHVVSPTVSGDTPEMFRSAVRDFSSTYKQFDPGHKHDLIVIGYNGQVPDEDRSAYDGIRAEFASYHGHGRDIAASASVARRLDSDLVIQLSTYTRFHREGWLSRFVDEVEKHGEGVYGASASYEQCPVCYHVGRKFYFPNPHIRTSCWGMSGRMWKINPHTSSIVNRENGFEFESGLWNVSSWATSVGLQSRLVTWESSYSASMWRTPRNIFRRGDQSNCLVFDRHHDIFFSSSRLKRARLAFSANGGIVGLVKRMSTLYGNC